jgi:hypothetical protein
MTSTFSSNDPDEVVQIEPQTTTTTKKFRKRRKNQWVIVEWCEKYCEYIIPPRDGEKRQKFKELPVIKSVRAYDQVDQGKLNLCIKIKNFLNLIFTKFESLI